MNTWFECKVSYEKNIDSGLLQKTTEGYLIDAATYTDAEARLIEEVTPFSSSGEVSITTIKRVKIAELFLSQNETDDKYYRCKVNLITLDEKSGAERKTGVSIIVQADSLPSAVSTLKKEMDTTLNTYDIASVSETNIMDVLQHQL